MACVSQAVALSGRRGPQLSSASLVGLAMALLDPSLSGQLGFLLSVSSVVGIGLFCPYARFALGEAALALGSMGAGAAGRGVPRPLGQALGRFGRVGRGALDALAVCVVCQASTFAIGASSFGSVSLVAPLANLLAAPVLGILMPLGLAAGVASPAPVAAMYQRALPGRWPNPSSRGSPGSLLWALQASPCRWTLGWPSWSPFFCLRSFSLRGPGPAAACLRVGRSLRLPWRGPCSFACAGLRRRASASLTWGRATPSWCRTGVARS